MAIRMSLGLLLFSCSTSFPWWKASVLFLSFRSLRWEGHRIRWALHLTQGLAGCGRRRVFSCWPSEMHCLQLGSPYPPSRFVSKEGVVIQLESDSSCTEIPAVLSSARSHWPSCSFLGTPSALAVVIQAVFQKLWPSAYLVCSVVPLARARTPQEEVSRHIHVISDCCVVVGRCRRQSFGALCPGT